MQIGNRLIPEDCQEKASVAGQSVVIFLQERGYKNILVIFCEEHPDKIIESETISHIVQSPMNKNTIDNLMATLNRRNKILYGGHDERSKS